MIKEISKYVFDIVKRDVPLLIVLVFAGLAGRMENDMHAILCASIGTLLYLYRCKTKVDKDTKV